MTSMAVTSIGIHHVLKIEQHKATIAIKANAFSQG